MILRRVIAHFRKQEWTAIAIDFLIVVVGVFIGIQVANWNAARAERQEYQRALERVLAEVTSNVSILDAIEESETRKLSLAADGLQALLTCEDSPENVALINQAIQTIGSTSTVHLQTTALDEMTSSPHLLSQQGDSIRSALASAKFRIGVMKTEADFAESLPFRDRPETNPILGLGEIYNREWTYYGIAVSRSYLPLELSVPVSEACRNDQLLKSFYTWQRFQSTIPAYSKAMRTELITIENAVEPVIMGGRQ